MLCRRLKWDFFDRHFLGLSFDSLGSTTDFFVHRSLECLCAGADWLSNFLTIDRFINTTNQLASHLTFLNHAFFIGVSIGICYRLSCIWKRHRFCFCYSPFGHLVAWILRLNRCFTFVAYFLCPFCIHSSSIGRILWLNRCFTFVAYFLRPFCIYSSGIGRILWLNDRFTFVAYFLRPFCIYHSSIRWGLWLDKGFTFVAYFLCPFCCDDWLRT